MVYATEVFGLRVWPRQSELLRAVRDHSRVTVTSGHKTGKTTSFAILAWWFADDPEARPEARVAMTSSSFRQVIRTLWREVRKLWRRATKRGYTLPEPALDPETGVRWEDEREIFGFSTKDPEKAAGTSGAHLLYLIDEASGVPNTVFEALEGNRAAGAGAKVVLASNPTQQSGEFFDSHHGKREFYYPLEISSEEAAKVEPPIPGLATQGWIDEKRREWKPDSPVYAVRVLGRFPASATDAVMGVGAVLAAVARWEDTEPEDDDPLVIGLDVARYGDDETTAAPRRGKKTYVLHRFPQGDGAATAAAFLLWLVGSGIRRNNERPRVNVDVIGYGSAVFDHLAGEGFIHAGVEWYPRTICQAVPVNTAESASDPTYANLRAELHFAGRAWLDEGGALPDDAELIREAPAPKYRIDPRGRLLVTSKDDLRADLGRSPDACDAWLLSLCERGAAVGDPVDPPDAITLHTDY